MTDLLLQVVIPHKHRPGTDLMSKLMLQNSKFMNLILKVLAGQNAVDCYVCAPCGYIDGLQSVVLFVPTGGIPKVDWALPAALDKSHIKSERPPVTYPYMTNRSYPESCNPSEELLDNRTIPMDKRLQYLVPFIEPDTPKDTIIQMIHQQSHAALGCRAVLLSLFIKYPHQEVKQYYDYIYSIINDSFKYTPVIRKDRLYVVKKGFLVREIEEHERPEHLTRFDAPAYHRLNYSHDFKDKKINTTYHFKDIVDIL